MRKRDLKRVGLIFTSIVLLGTGLNINHQKNKEIESLQSEIRESYANNRGLKKLIIEYDTRLKICQDNVGSLNSYLDELNELEKLRGDLEKYQATLKR